MIEQNDATNTGPTEVIVLRGGTGSCKTMIASSLMGYYKEMGWNGLFFDAEDIREEQFQHLYDASFYSYLLICISPDEKFNPPCLEKPYRTINIS